ncbi:hypothetical protein [Streptomyces sp. UG1]|uniref:hypothetical protein n=1 Tax=Streptomyces sp. UG1 TaxID=3417652 RepID=UPI003CE9DD06
MAQWETSLANQQKLREEHDRFTRAGPRVLTSAERQTITALASDITGLWHAKSTMVTDRKELVRPVQRLNQLSYYP